MQQSYWTPLPEDRSHAPPPADYYPWFDWLRASLAVVVMLLHDSVITWQGAGTLAIEIFFALSGWLIGSILLKVTPGNLPRFFFNRAVRIWCPYYIAFGLLLAASLMHDTLTPKWLEFITYKFLMVWNQFGPEQLFAFRAQAPLQATGNHFWSVNAQEQFYLLAPALLVLAPAWGRSILLWLGLALGACLSGIYPAIVLGVLAALIADRWPGIQRLGWVRVMLLLMLLACAVALYAGIELTSLAPLCAIAIVLLLAVKGPASGLGRLAGGMSYPLYLNHWVGVFVANALLAPYELRDTPLRQFLACVFSLCLAVALYVLVDRRLLERRSAWLTPERARACMAAAYAMVGSGVLLGLCLRN